MCGIICQVEKRETDSGGSASEVTTTKKSKPALLREQKLHSLLKSRGPDAEQDVSFHSTNFSIKLTSYILWTQGLNIQYQPFVSETHAFVFNGDIYSFQGVPLPQDENDGSFLFDILQTCYSDTDILDVISQLHGPFSFILVDKEKSRIWFARDFFGRSSLLFGDCHNDSNSTSFFVSSVAPFNEAGNTIEVPSAGVFCLNLNLDVPVLSLFPWECLTRRVYIRETAETFLNLLSSKRGFTFRILNSVKANVTTILKHDSCSNDVLLKLEALARSGLSDNEILSQTMHILEIPLLKFFDCLTSAVRTRVKLKPSSCKQCIKAKILTRCCHSQISILFSGGLDSTVLAHIVCAMLTEGESVDLINVAFSDDQICNFDVPDRDTGRKAFQVLRDIYDSRGITINFVEANVTKSEVQKFRQMIIQDLVSPLQSVLDDSIGCCLWFAARGQGIISNSVSKNMYTSPARICFVGSGADELLGGYSRHRSAFENKGWQGLVNEMQEDIDRISFRNLGRDNRVITNHGICPRMPFLDENVVSFLTKECDVWIKCCPLFPRGLGEKILLRALAVKLFGSQNVNLALFPKRAMQFGSRIAKLENSKEKGGDLCKRLSNIQNEVNAI